MTLHEGEFFVNNDGDVVENMIIVTYPGTDTALTVNRDNVVIRNVIVYHPASSRGIYGY